MSDIALRVEGLGKRYRIGVQETGGGHHRRKSLRGIFGGIGDAALSNKPANPETEFAGVR